MRAMTDINVTPMIDVLLVLLIVFMVAVPIMQRSLEVLLPRPAPEVIPDPPPPPTAVLAVYPDRFALGAEHYVSLADLERGLAAVYALRQDRTLVVRAEGPVAYGRVISAMDAARGAGVSHIGLVSAPLH